MKKPKIKEILLILLLILVIALCLLAYHRGIFSDLETLRSFAESLGWATPIMFIILHLLQILVPFIPGGLVLTAVVIVLGPFSGFVVNFVGIILGSWLSFGLARYLGRDFVRRHIPGDVWQKYFRWLDNEKVFRRTFFLLILLPFAPDDALCMLAGIAKISARDFAILLILGKIPVLLLYSLGMLGADSLLK